MWVGRGGEVKRTLLVAAKCTHLNWWGLSGRTIRCKVADRVENITFPEFNNHKKNRFGRTTCRITHFVSNLGGQLYGVIGSEIEPNKG